LQGERAPPILIEEAVQYQPRRKIAPTVKTVWHRARFVNQAREDGLMLLHWKSMQEPLSRDGLSNPDETKDAILQPKTVDGKEQMMDTETYRFAKYNIKISHPTYDSELYDQHLKNPDWSREETEYLLDTHKEYYGKWHIISDRYDFKPTVAHDVVPGADPATQSEPAHRTMEDLKQRFFQVSAALMAAQTPLTNMTTAEFDLHEKLQKFEPKQEIARKRHKELILARSDEDKKEEEHLIAELRRIYLRQKRNEDERAELRDRLDHSITDAAPDAPQYKSSAEINALFQKITNKEKSQRPRRSLMDNSMMQSPANAGNTPGGHSKRGSVAIGPGGTTPGVRRQLTPREEARFGVSHHDRLTSGVAFRSDRILKVRQAKSQVQTQKIAAVLAELQVPDLFQMPTNAVVGGMEKLVQKVGMLIEARKIKEKEENDLKIAKERKKMRDEGGTVDDTQVDETKVEDETEQPDVDMEDSRAPEDQEETEMPGEDVEEEEEEEGEDEEENQDQDQDQDESEENNSDREDEDGDNSDGEEEETFLDARDGVVNGDQADEDDSDQVSERQDSEEAREEEAERQAAAREAQETGEEDEDEEDEAEDDAAHDENADPDNQADAGNARKRGNSLSNTSAAKRARA
jgi:DNA methyltransferase 1-associated protein 1